jgi:hypothetical protein
MRCESEVPSLRADPFTLLTIPAIYHPAFLSKGGGLIYEMPLEVRRCTTKVVGTYKEHEVTRIAERTAIEKMASFSIKR